MFVLDNLGSASSWSTQHMVHRVTDLLRISMIPEML